MSWISTSRAASVERPILAVATFVAVVSLCIDAGASLTTIGGFVTTGLMTGIFWAMFGPAWPMWLLSAVRLFALVALAVHRRRLTGAALVLLVVTTVLSEAWSFIPLDGASRIVGGVRNVWADGMLDMAAALPVFAALGLLVFSDRYWHQDVRPGTWWRWLVYIAVPTGALSLAAAFVASILLPPGGIVLISLAWLTGPIVAGLLYWLTVNREASLYMRSIGFALVLLGMLPEIVPVMIA